MSALYQDIFDVQKINPEGKKFERVNHSGARCDQTVYAPYAPGATRGADNGFGGAGGYGDGPGVRSDRGAVAYLGRTYFETTEYVLPAPQMQPLWESVKKWEGGPTDFGLSYHRAFYEREYDNLHDIYLQRWRQEDRPWQVLCVNRVTGEQRARSRATSRT